MQFPLDTNCSKKFGLDYALFNEVGSHGAKMKKQLSLWIEQLGELLISRDKNSDFQTLRLFAILAALTFIFVVMLTVVQFSPVAPAHSEIRPSQGLGTEAKLSP